MGHAEMSLAELVQLKPGDVVPIEAPQAATLLIGDVPVLAGRFGVSRGLQRAQIIRSGCTWRMNRTKPS